MLDLSILLTRTGNAASSLAPSRFHSHADTSCMLSHVYVRERVRRAVKGQRI